MEGDARIVVVGATGYSGRLIARELARAGTRFVLAGRDAGRLQGLAQEIGGAETQAADVEEPESLRRLFRAGDVVINCAGPFTELGEGVVRACIESRAHYLDITGEQEFMWRIRERYDAAARQAGVVVVNAIAFEYALGDCAAAVAAAGLVEPLRSVDVTYAWRGGAAGASRGTRRSALRILAARGRRYEQGVWRPERTARLQRGFRLPDGRVRQAVNFPAGEVLTVPRHLRVRQVRGWAVVGRRTARLASLLSPALPLLVRLAKPLLERALRRGPEGPSPEQRRQSSFLILAEAEAGDGLRRRVALQGHDPYSLTAEIALRGAGCVSGAARQGASGVLAPAQVLDPRAFLGWLRGRGVEWREEEASPDLAGLRDL